MAGREGALSQGQRAAGRRRKRTWGRQPGFCRGTGTSYEGGSDREPAGEVLGSSVGGTEPRFQLPGVPEPHQAPRVGWGQKQKRGKKEVWGGQTPSQAGKHQGQALLRRPSPRLSAGPC